MNKEREVKPWKPNYHIMYEKFTERFHHVYGRIYNNIYEKSYQLSSKYSDPFSKSNPSILLCGTAASETTKDFVSFVKNKNPNSRVKVLDVHTQPLIESQKKLDTDQLGIEYINGNALDLPFADNSIDLIETDFFLQFFSKEGKKVVINEWARVLSNDGVITTRDFLPRNRVSGIANRVRRKVLHRLNIDTYESSGNEIEELFKSAGFKVDIVPFRFGTFQSKLFKYIIAYKDPNHNILD